MFDIRTGKRAEGVISASHAQVVLSAEIEQQMKLIGLFAELAQGFKWTRFPPAGRFNEWPLPTAAHGQQLTALYRGPSPHEVYLKSSYGFEHNPYFSGPISLSKAAAVRARIEKAYEASEWIMTPPLEAIPLGEFSIQLEMRTDSTLAHRDSQSIKVLIDVSNPFEFFVSTLKGTQRTPQFYGPFKLS